MPAVRSNPEILLYQALKTLGVTLHAEAPVEAHERLAVLSREGVHTERVRAADCATETQAKACAAKLLGILQKFGTNR